MCGTEDSNKNLKTLLVFLYVSSLGFIFAFFTRRDCGAASLVEFIPLISFYDNWNTKIVTCNGASHSLAYTMAEYHYGTNGGAPRNLIEDIQEYPEWGLLGVVFMLQILADALLWTAVIIKGNKHFTGFWVITTIVNTLYSALMEVSEEWGLAYDGATALQKIFSFLWGTVLFGFFIITGIQTYFYLSSEDGRVKLSPVGQGVCAIRDYYRENPTELAVISLLSEIAAHIHRSFHYPITAYLMEASIYLNYVAPREWGVKISITTIVVNTFGLILLAFKSPVLRKAWGTIYVIIILVHFVQLVYIVIDWSPVNILPHIFNGFVFVSLVHLVYKVGVLYTFLKGSVVHKITNENSNE